MERDPKKKTSYKFFNFVEKKSALIGIGAAAIVVFTASAVATSIALFEGVQWAGSRWAKERIEERGGVIFTRKPKAA